MTRDVVICGRKSALVHAAIALFAICLLVTSAQAMMSGIPDPSSLAADADEIVRGTLTDVHSQWNADHTNIVTTATVTVKSRAKGQGPDLFTLTVPGGTADGITQWVEDQAALVPGEAFIFVKKGTKYGATVLGGERGLVPVHGGKVSGGAKVKDSGVAADEYALYLSALTKGQSPVPPQSGGTTNATGETPIITGMTFSGTSPSTASAGTGTRVTITGSGFGTKASRDSKADVAFSYVMDPDPDYFGVIWCSGWPWYNGAGAPYGIPDNAYDIVSWTDSQIVVNVPVGYTSDGYAGSACSGLVLVFTDANTVSEGRPFTVTFGYGKAKWSAPAGFYVNPGTLGSGAATAIQNAANTWNAAIPTSSFRFNYLGTSSSTVYSDTQRDYQNLICFRPASDFAANPDTIAEAVTWSDQYGNIVEVDIKFNLGFAWTTGTAIGSTQNVETIALHELGHWLHLRDLYGYDTRYPTDLGEVMFGINNDAFGNKNLKTLDADDAAGIRWIYPAAPLTATSITPNSGIQGSTVAVTNLAGTGFQSGATVKLTRSGSTDIVATSVAVTSANKITCQFALPSAAPTGAWNVVVTNPGGQSATLTGGFTITAPALTVTSITPNSGIQGTTVAVTNLAGTGFLTGATVKLQRSGYTDISATSVAVVSPNKITCQFAVPLTAATGAWNVVVTNPGGQSATLTNGFTITTPPLTVTAITPNTGTQGTTVAITNLAGAGFVSGATVKLTRTGAADIAATGVAVVSANKITCSFALPSTAATGAWNVVVTSGGQSATLAGGFTVNSPALTVTAITPNTGTQGTTVAVTNLAGTGFLTGATVKLTRSGSTDIAATSVAVVSSTTITCQFAVPSTAATGAWNVVVTNPSSQSATLAGGFTVNSPPLTVTAITPNTGTQGSTVAITNLAGTGFQSGATVKLVRAGSADITATSVVVVSPTKITCQFALPSNAMTGAWNVVVNSGGQSTTLTGGFTITLQSMTVNAITPNGGIQGSTVAVTNLAGTGFASGATVKLQRTGSTEIAATSVVVLSSTRITCSLALPSTAATGAWNVVVTNPGGQSVTLVGGFTVSNAPATATFRFAPGSLQVPVGATRTTTLYLDGLATGLAGFEITVSLADPDAGEIVGATMYDSFMTSISPVPADSITLTAADLGEMVEPGGNALVGTISVRGDRAGRTELRISQVWVDDDSGNAVSPQQAVCTVDVGTPPVLAVPGGTGLPGDLDLNGLYEDVNGNGRPDFADVVLFFNQMSWIAANEPVTAFDYNANGRIDFADVTWLFSHL